MRYVTVGLFTLFLLSISVAEAQESEAGSDFPGRGSEVLFVFLSTADYVGNSEDRFDEVVRAIKVELRERVESGGQAFYAIGATLLGSIEEGLDYLVRGITPHFGQKDFGPWDEVWAGRNPLNNVAIDYMWRGLEGEPDVPQIVVIERGVRRGSDGIEVARDRLLARAVGVETVLEWYDTGMPLTLAVVAP